MPSRNITDLTPAMQGKARATVERCRRFGVDLLIYCTLRTLQEQAKLYRQSRSFGAIERKAVDLSTRGFGFLAEILMEVGAQTGPHVTNAGPGESWHNFAEAFDAVPLIHGKPAWSYRKYQDQWNKYGRAAVMEGLTWAGHWRTFREYPHAQLRPDPNPLRIYGPDDVRRMLTSRGLL